MRSIRRSPYSRMIPILLLLVLVPFLSGCTEEEGEEEDPFTDFSLLGKNQKAEDYPRSFHVDQVQNVHISVGNHEGVRTDYTVRISISSGAWVRSYGDLSSVIVSSRYSPEMRFNLRDDEEKTIPCGFSIPDEGAFEMRFQLLREGVEYRSLELWVKVFRPDRMKVSPEGLHVYAAGRDGNPAHLPSSTDVNGFFNFSMGIDAPQQVSVDLNFTFRIGEVSTWTGIEWTGGSGGLLTAVFESGTGHYLNTRMSNRDYLVMPLSFVMDVNDVRMIIEVNSSDWSLEFSIPIDE
ncbi:MAG: DUF1616 domain-containing protein [Thermoplasmatota archaeon]